MSSRAAAPSPRLEKYRLRKTLREKLARLSPFGLGHTKPRHLRDMLRVIWRNRDNLPHAWRVLTKGVCDGCALGVAGLHDWTISGPHLCLTRLNLLRLNTVSAFDPALLADAAPLARQDNAALRELGRLAHPMVRRHGEAGFSRVSWDEVNRRLGARLAATAPERMAFFVTARGVTNEVYYVAQKVARFLGTPHIDNAARLCHAPSTSAMKEMTGVAASTCTYADWFKTDLILIVGANPANDQPVSTKYLLLAKQRGAKIVVINPYLEPGLKRYWIPSTPLSAVFGSDLADYWFPVAQGGDVAFFYGVLRVLFERGAVDAAYLRDHVDPASVEALRAECLATPLAEYARRAGTRPEAIEALAEQVGGAARGIVVWSMGLTQSPAGADAVRIVLDLALARGWIGREGTGAVPIRGHSSVQGGGEMGCYSTALPGAVPLTPANLAALEAQYGFPIPPGPGLTTPGMLEAAHRGQLDVLYAVGGNFLRTLPDPDHVREALARTPVRVHQDIILTDQMFVPPAPGGEVWLLPAQTRYEQEGGGVETSTERRVMFSPCIPREVGEARAEWRILRDLAAAAHPARAHLLGCETGQAIREEIARVVPFYAGIEKLAQTGDSFVYGGPHLCAEGVFPLPGGRARMTTPRLPSARPDDGRFFVSTRRGKQFNTLIYAEIDPLNDAPRDAVLMNEEDAAERGLMHGDRVRLRNVRGEYIGRVHLAPLTRGDLQIHWPEGNHLLDREARDRASDTPDYNAWVTLEKAPAAVGTDADRVLV
ncbi:MAG: molybdopterin-dependent oxidoreductase [Opitutaceae bacterium]|jgi:molybdopterin-dependent oxidoreductase alpha subunit|nr:molybdopterin-dependent oxidoreductase [Opitutaceae bacterium]